ncbi:hypothetical protein [Aureimonas sp. AU4]|uniref:hypothetical protein n=1 Tax=Aureimonas sp. AU4 TaxID=1638163 RepID=UPI000A529A21|nr:hypothetical protein [Aureimonas sp. AU4]
MPTFTLVFKNSAADSNPYRREVEAKTKSEALAQAPGIQSELGIKADVIEAYQEGGIGA